MRMIAFYGKGGIGKSTLVSALSTLFAKNGHRVLQFGCDPKSDSCFTLLDGPITTVMEEWTERGEQDLTLEHCLMTTPNGVDCLEVGGPQPGSGCAGRGITKTLEMIGSPTELKNRYDIVLFDVLGDVVCGGFSAPMREGYAQEVYIVTSGEFRSLYAANNIAFGVKKNAINGTRLGGLIANLRNVPEEVEKIEQLAKLLKTRVAGVIPRDDAIGKAELMRRPVVDTDPNCPATKALMKLSETISAIEQSQLVVPAPLPRIEFENLFFNTRSTS